MNDEETCGGILKHVSEAKTTSIRSSPKMNYIQNLQKNSLFNTMQALVEYG